MISQSESHLQEMWGLPGMLFNRDYDWLVSPGLYVPICMTYALAAYVARIRMRSRPEQSSATGEATSAAAAASSARKKLTLSTQHQHGGSSSSSSSSGSSEIPDGLLLRTAMQVYNLTQVVVCGYMMMGMGRVWWDGLAERPNLIGFFAAAHGRRGDVEHFIFIHYLSKYLDMFDTLFIVLRGRHKQLSFLQVFHHATIGPVWGFVLGCGQGSGPSIFGALINSFTHVLMYVHYAWTSTGRTNPFKLFLTLWQITQFALCIAQAVVVATYIELSDITPGLAALQVGYHICMIVLFGRFLMESSIAKARRRRGKQQQQQQLKRDGKEKEKEIEETTESKKDL